MHQLTSLLAEIRACTICAAHLEHDPRPVLAAGGGARLLIAGQAPGRRVHASGVAWQDPSGDRLREWLGLDESTFYDPDRVALLPMGFCWPGTGTNGDLPPRPECAATWHPRLVPMLPRVELTVVIGRYAQDWHLAGRTKPTVTATVAAWRDYLPTHLPIPHPSPRNQRWLKQNPWFAAEVLPELRRRVRALGL
jgi:uracil-DNA glycosylase